MQSFCEPSSSLNPKPSSMQPLSSLRSSSVTLSTSLLSDDFFFLCCFRRLSHNKFLGLSDMDICLDSFFLLGTGTCSKRCNNSISEHEDEHAFSALSAINIRNVYMCPNKAIKNNLVQIINEACCERRRWQRW